LTVPYTCALKQNISRLHLHFNILWNQGCVCIV
jgi:hypothetical protein